jgi:phage I-like protein
MTTSKIMVILEAGAIPPEWIHLLPLGELKLADSREPIRVDSQALNQIIAAGQERGNDLVIDYEHQTLSGGEAPAAGWIKELQARGDGLWARVEWTGRATAYITNREYRYFSPVLTLDEQRRPTALLNAGLTNFPAITHLPPLVAKSREGMEVATPQMTTGQRPVPLESTTSRAQVMGAKPNQQEAEMLTQLKGILGLAAEAQETEILAAVKGSLQQGTALKGIITALELPPDAAPEQIAGAITALKGGQGKLISLEMEVEGP